MEALLNLLSWRILAAAGAFYLVGLAFYRIFLHPLARFPGPKLAAITRYYEAYYDIVKNGQYTFKIVELHRKYGKSDPAANECYPLCLTCNAPPKAPSSGSALMNCTSSTQPSLRSSIAKTDAGTSMLGLTMPSQPKAP